MNIDESLSENSEEKDQSEEPTPIPREPSLWKRLQALPYTNDRVGLGFVMNWKPLRK